MALNLGSKGVPQLFPHSRQTDTGGGKERPGQATIVVSLDGTGDTDNLIDAIALLPTGGGIISVKEGQYDSGEIIINRDNVTIQGTGKGTFINSSSNNGISASGRNGFLIKNIRIESNFVAIRSTACTESTITECWFTSGGDANGIFAIGSGGSLDEGLIISNNHFSNPRNGILLSDTKGTIITGNKMIVTVTNSNRGIIIIGEDETSESNIISDNVIDGYDDQGIDLDVTTATQKNIIIGNRILNSTIGIEVRTGVDRTLIIGNILTDNTTPISDSGTNTLAANNIIA